ncbi:WD40-repeat-containing domain protein [Mrakia frigida]|uniref:WD40 repeat domain-containing protein n=1 Tax=Mrakia frigida TaxID=29902 RepID=UPI003FCC1175
MSSSSSTPSVKATSLPYIDIQPDFASVLRDVSQSVIRAEEFWVSGYWEGKKSVHGKVHCSMDEDGDLKTTTSGGVVLGPIGEDSSAPLKISFPSLGIPPTTVRQPRQTIRPSKTSAFPKSLNSFSLSPTQPLLSVAGDDGALLVVPTTSSSSSSSAPLVLKEAIGDVLSTTFFPSGTVTLSTTLTSTLLIHSALPTQTSASPSNAPARVLKGHTRPVTCSAILGRGKNVLSGSKDRTVRRWDVGKAEEVVAGRVEFGDEVWCLASEQNEGEREAEETKRVWVGLKSGGVWRLETEGEGLKNSGVGIEGGKEGGVNAIAISSTLLATATDTGILSIYTLPSSTSSSPPTLLAKLRRSPGAINSLAFLPDGRLLVGGEDGMPWIAAADLQTLPEAEGGGLTWGVSEELAGWEDPIVCVRVGTKGGEVWVGSGKEGVGRY